MSDERENLAEAEAEVREYAADSGDVILRRALAPVLAEYDRRGEEIEQLQQEMADFRWQDGPNGPMARMRRAVQAHEACEFLYAGLRESFDRARAERDEALAQLKALRIKVGEWAERINRHDVPDEFVTYVDASQRLLDIIWEMRDAASIERTSRGENA